MKWFTADNHFDHAKIIGKMGRDGGYATVDDHNRALIDNLNSYVERTDFLYILGDFAFQRAPYWRSQIRCKNIVFVKGNHDRTLGSLRAFGTVREQVVLKMGADKAYLSHYPHAYWPSSHYGSFHFYGHCHRQREGTLDSLFPGRRSIDVGVDNAWHYFRCHRPFSEMELREILQDRPGHDLKEFYDQFTSFGGDFIPRSTGWRIVDWVRRCVDVSRRQSRCEQV